MAPSRAAILPESPLSEGHRLRSFYCYLQVVFTYYGTPGLGPPDTGLWTRDLSRPTCVLYVASGVLANACTYCPSNLRVRKCQASMESLQFAKDLWCPGNLGVKTQP